MLGAQKSLMAWPESQQEASTSRLALIRMEDSGLTMSLTLLNTSSSSASDGEELAATSLSAWTSTLAT
jgi:hypothetical protein